MRNYAQIGRSYRRAMVSWWDYDCSIGRLPGPIVAQPTPSIGCTRRLVVRRADLTLQAQNMSLYDEMETPKVEAGAPAAVSDASVFDGLGPGERLFLKIVADECCKQ